MQLKVDQVADHLKQSLLPVYLVTGDETLQVMETAEKIRVAATQQGFSERDILTVDPQFDWGVLTESAEALSLFAEKKILDLRLGKMKAGQAGSKAFQAYLKHLPTDKLLLIQAARFDKSARNAAWVKAIDKQGAIINVWDLSAAQTVAWVAKRMQQAGLNVEQEAVRYLSDRIEGNLLAAQQEIDKLKLLFNDQTITVQQIRAVVADNARFSVFDLGEAILQQDSQRILHILTILKAEDTALPLLVWALGDVMRQGYQFAQTQQLGRVSPARRNQLQRAHYLQQLPWVELFAKLGELEQHSKGVGELAPKNQQSLWDEATMLALSCAGITMAPSITGD